mgnify:CR=1 FL=1
MSVRIKLIVTLAASTLLAGCGGDSAPGDASAAPPAPAGAWAGPLERTEPERVLVLMIDTLRADKLGAYGSDAGLTPNLDAFAEEAVVFDNAYATSSWTRPTVASMVTGRYPTSHTAVGKEDALPAEALTVVEILEDTAATWSFGITTNANISAEVGFGQAYDKYGPLRGARRRSYPEDRIGLVPADEVVAATIQRLRDDPAAGAERTFGFVQFIDPHDPYYENPEHNPQPRPPCGEFMGSRTDIDRMMAAGRSAWTDRNIDWLEYLYDGEIAFLDHAFGRFIETLREQGLYEGSMIVVVSDHGEAFWEHGQRGHGKSLYEEEARVPFMIRFAGMPADDARRIDRPVSVVDIAPTIVDAFGLPAPEAFEGSSLIPLIVEGTRERRLDYVFSELGLFDNYSESALRHGRHKMKVRYWHNRDGAGSVVAELYDLRTDPGEQRNLAGSEAHRATYRDMLARLSVWEADVSEWSLDGTDVDIRSLDEETRKELRGLGYIQ